MVTQRLEELSLNLKITNL